MPAHAAVLILAASLAASASPPPAPANVISPLDVPGHGNRVIMARPDRSGDKVICHNQPIPDSRFSNRVCARRRDLEAASAARRQQITQHQHTCDIVGAC